VNAEVVNKFLNATSTVLSEYFNVEIKETGGLTMVTGSDALDPITVILGITGDLEGQFLLAYSKDTALGIARSMMGNSDYPEFDDMCKSALAELGNMIGGMTSTGLAEMGYFCNLSPPSVVTTEQGTISLGMPTMICLPITTGQGAVRVCIGLKSAN
jgi:chemotaxis protein CheX